MLERTLEHPEKLYPIIGILFILLVVMYMRGMGKRQIHAPSNYLGTANHRANMSELIEDVARKVILDYPTLDDRQHAQIVSDTMRLRGMTNINLYESAIYATLTRLKGIR